jgi:hypothetical protein
LKFHPSSKILANSNEKILVKKHEISYPCPEFFNQYEQISMKYDIFCLALVYYEMRTNDSIKNNFEDMNTLAQIELPTNVNSTIQDLYKGMINYLADLRPNIEKIITHLYSLRSDEALRFKSIYSQSKRITNNIRFNMDLTNYRTSNYSSLDLINNYKKEPEIDGIYRKSSIIGVGNFGIFFNSKNNLKPSGKYVC